MLRGFKRALRPGWRANATASAHVWSGSTAGVWPRLCRVQSPQSCENRLLPMSKQGMGWLDDAYGLSVGMSLAGIVAPIVPI